MMEDDGIPNGTEIEIGLSKEAIKRINVLKPLFCVICGDLIDQRPAPEGDIESPNYHKYMALFKELWAEIDPSIPLICTCGNHDIGNVPNGIMIEKYKKSFGDDYFAFWAGGCRFIVLNSTLAVQPQDAQSNYSEQMAWFDKELEYLLQHKPTHVIIFQHHPFFLEDPNEEDKYFSPTSPINYPKKEREIWLAKLQKTSITAVFAGHYHREAYGKLNQMEMVTTGALGQALGKDPSGLRIVKVYKDSIKHDYYPVEKIPDHVDLN